MANYVKAIEFDSPLHQKQAVSHVMRSIELEFQKNHTALDLKTPLVQVIYDKLDHSNPTVVQCCSSILLSATERGWIQFTNVLNGLLNVMPTTRHPGILLKCLADLLCLELRVTVKTNGDTYNCPYSIRGKKPHPFISVTTSSPQLWSRLLALTKQMLLHSVIECQSYIVDMLKPFIKYCLVSPGEEGLPISMATETFTVLTSVVHHYLHKVDNAGGDNVSLKVGDNVVSLLTTLLPCFQMLNSEQAIEVAGRAEELVCCLVKMAPWCPHGGLSQSLCDTVQSIICELFVNQEHVAILSLLKSFLLLTNTYKKLLYRTHNIFWFSWMLLSCIGLPSYTSILLPQVQCLVESDPPKELILPLMFPLSVVLCAGSCQQLVGELLVRVNKNLTGGATPAVPTRSAEAAMMMPTATSELYAEICATAQLYSQLCRCPTQKHAWLESLQQKLEQQELHISGDMNRLLLIMLSSIYFHQEPVIQLGTVDALRKFVKRTPILCPEVLVFVQYLLSLQGSKELSLKLLYLLPALATHKVMVGRVVRVIHGLSEKVSLYPVIIRLLCKVWLEKDEVFVHLHKLLVAPLPRHTPPEVCREITLAKVATVCDICHSRPELHAEEMVGLVLQFLTEFSLQNPSMSAGNDDGTMMALSVKSLHRLCLSEMVDFPAAWNMIAPKLKGERRPKVLVVMCHLFSLIPTLEVDEALQPLYDAALTFLWNCVSSADGSVVEASFKTLCHFEPNDFKLIYLPNKLLSQLDCVDIATQDNVLVLSGQQCVQVAVGISPDGFTGYSDFLARVLAIEMEQFLRGVAHLTQRHFPQLERFIRDSSQHLSKFISNNDGATYFNDCYFIGGLLMAFQLAEPERGSRGYQQQLNNVVKNYKAMWSRCLTVDISISSSACLHQLLSLPHSWAAFMDRFYTIHVKSRLLEVCPANMRDDKTSPGYQQKQWEAECWVRCKLVEQLQMICNDGHLCSVLLSLCGMSSTCTTISDTVGSVEGSVAWLRDWSSSVFLASLLSTIASVTGGRNDCKETGDNIFSFITNAFKSTPDRSTVSCIATIAAVQVIKHIAASFPLVILSSDVKDSMITIATNILSNLNVSDERSILKCYSLCEILLVIHHQLPKMSPLLGNVVQLCSVTSCNVLSACVLGGLLPVLCEEGGGAHSVARKFHKELVTGLVMSRYNTATIQFQAACLAVARVTPIMYIAGILTLDDCKACITILQGLASKLHKCYVIHLSLGTLLSGLVSECTPNGRHILNDVTAQWTAAVQSQDSGALAGLYVMIGSVGCCGVLFSHASITSLLQHHLQAIILTCSTLLFSVLNHSKMQDEINHTLWMIVQLRTAAMEAITKEHNLPKNYSYLMEERALPAVFECLSNCREQRQSEVVVSGLLRVLSQCSSLPPVDWTGVLLNIVRRMPNMYQSCLQCALKLTNTSKGFHMFIVYCCSPVVLCNLETTIQQMLMSKLHLLIDDISSPSLGDLLGSWSHVCQQKKELLGSFVEGLRQALELTEIIDTKMTLLNYCVWSICHLLQQFPLLLEYAIHHKTTVADITKCILATSTGDPHAAAVTLETEMPSITVLKSLIYSHLISSVSHTHHNFLHSCLTALPALTSASHYILMNLLNSILHSTCCVNKQDLFLFLTHCIKESMQNTYVSKAEAELLIKVALLGSWGCRNSIDLWLGFLGNSRMSTADPHLVHTHLNQLIAALLMCLATSKNSPANLKQLLSQWVIEMVMKNSEDVGHPGSNVILVTNGGSALWRVWINFV